MASPQRMHCRKITETKSKPEFKYCMLNFKAQFKNMPRSRSLLSTSIKKTISYGETYRGVQSSSEEFLDISCCQELCWGHRRQFGPWLASWNKISPPVSFVLTIFNIFAGSLRMCLIIMYGLCDGIYTNTLIYGLGYSNLPCTRTHTSCKSSFCRKNHLQHFVN